MVNAKKKFERLVECGWDKEGLRSFLEFFVTRFVPEQDDFLGLLKGVQEMDWEELDAFLRSIGSNKVTDEFAGLYGREMTADKLRRSVKLGDDLFAKLKELGKFRLMDIPSACPACLEAEEDGEEMPQGHFLCWSRPLWFDRIPADHKVEVMPSTYSDSYGWYEVWAIREEEPHLGHYL